MADALESDPHPAQQNDVPVAEYMLMTEPVHDRIDASACGRSASHNLELDDIGKTEASYVDLERYVGEVPASPRPTMLGRLGRHFKLIGRSMPSMLGLGNARAGFRNVPGAPPLAAS